MFLYFIRKEKKTKHGILQNFLHALTLAKGFTLLELMLTVSVVGLLLTLVVVNIAGTRNVRNLKIAQNLLVTNLRKAQSYSLLSRNIYSKVPVQFYLIKIDLNKPREYTLQAIYNISTSPKMAEVEKINLPEGIRFDSLSPILIDRPVGFTDQIPVYPNGCIILAFKAPYAKIIANNGCAFFNFVGDDYTRVKDFVYNEETNTASSDSIVNLKLSDSSGGISKIITINGINGSIMFEQ